MTTTDSENVPPLENRANNLLHDELYDELTAESYNRDNSWIKERRLLRNNAYARLGRDYVLSVGIMKAMEFYGTPGKRTIPGSKMGKWTDNDMFIGDFPLFGSNNDRMVLVTTEEFLNLMEKNGKIFVPEPLKNLDEQILHKAENFRDSKFFTFNYLNSKWLDTTENPYTPDYRDLDDDSYRVKTEKIADALFLSIYGVNDVATKKSIIDMVQKKYKISQ